MSLAQDRDTKQRVDAQLYNLGVAAGKLVYAGALVCINATGFATPGALATGLICIGRAEAQVDNTLGADGALSVDVRRGVFRWANSAAGDAIAETDMGELCYVVDDQTVAKTSAAGTRSVAGRIFDIDAQGVWVDTRIPVDQRKVFVPLALTDLISGNAHVYRVSSPVAGRITRLVTNLGAALATGNATATGKIGAAAITNGVVNIVQAGSAAGQVNNAVPTAANAVDVDSDINFTIGGTNTGASSATLIVEITRN